MKPLRVIMIIGLMAHGVQAFAAENRGLDILANAASEILLRSALPIHAAPTIEPETKKLVLKKSGKFPEKEESKPVYEIERVKDFMKRSEEDVLEILATFNVDLKKKYFIRDSQPHAVNILYCAIEAGYLDVVMHLIEDKKMEAYNVCGWLGNYEKYGENALNVAAKCGHLKIVRYLMEDREMRWYHSNSYDKGDVLHAAVRGGHLDIVRYLVEDRHVNIYTKTAFNEDAFSIARGSIRDYLEDRKKITPDMPIAPLSTDKKVSFVSRTGSSTSSSSFLPITRPASLMLPEERMSNQDVFQETLSLLNPVVRSDFAQVLVALEGNEGAKEAFSSVLKDAFNINGKRVRDKTSSSSVSKHPTPAA